MKLYGECRKSGSEVQRQRCLLRHLQRVDRVPPLAGEDVQRSPDERLRIVCSVPIRTPYVDEIGPQPGRSRNATRSARIWIDHRRR